MKRFLKALLLSVVLGAGFAHTADAKPDTVLDVSALSEEQQLALRQKMVELKKEVKAETADVSTAKKLSEWATLGQQFGSGLAQTAKELGIAANEFVDTPVGKLVAAIILWKLAGSAIVHIGFGLLFFAVAFSIWFYNWRRMCIVKSEKPTGSTRCFGLIAVKECTYYEPGEVDGTRGAMAGVAFLLVVITVLIMFTFS